MRILKKWLTLSLVLVLTTNFVGCSKTEETKAEEKNLVSKEQVREEENLEVSYPIQLVDSYDREITLEKEPKKVISVGPNITEILFELGVKERLVARTNYCDYPEAVSEIPSIGTLKTPDIELIISLTPDLVITSTHFDEENTRKLEDAGIKVMGLYEKNNVTGVYRMIETIGTALNKKEKALEVVESMKETITQVTNKVKDLEAPSVYYVVGYGESDHSAPENTFVGQLLKLAGGNNIVPASDSWAYSKELLLEQDPYVIILRKGEKDNFCSTQGYKELTAVKEGRVYEIDNNLLDRQGWRNGLGVLELAKILHPEGFVSGY